jgi:hypothetical protein
MYMRSRRSRVARGGARHLQRPDLEELSLDSRRIEISARIWSEWQRQLGEEEDDPAVDLLFRPSAGGARSTEGMGEIIERVRWECAQEPETPFPGEWFSLRSVDGLLVRVSDCDDLHAVSHALRQRSSGCALGTWRTSSAGAGGS